MSAPDAAFMIPSLPFEARCHPLWELAEDRVRTWLAKIYPHGTAADAERFEEGRAARVAGYFFPDADLEDLVTLTAMIEAIFMYDDRIAYDRSSSPEDAHALAYRLQLVLQTGQVEPSDDPDLIALGEILQRIYPRQSEDWRSRFRRHIWNFLFANAAELENRLEGHTPGLREYMAIRRETIGVLPALDLAEFAGHYELPDILYDDPDLHELRQCYLDIVAWMNDIYSYQREDAAGEVNLVHVLRAENKTSLAATFDDICEMIEARISHFIESERRFRDSDTHRRITETERAAVDASVAAMKYAMAGSRRWQAEVKRYTTAQR
ncbi:hypothetical protein [Nocardia sp. NPDC050175]|uniref:terpene synthase family protein n=1 Tax=Nocardia sp. NPDC050175 TaxID=3364317 RepID=UPI0037B2D48D